jgi:hypothetical protein
MTADELARLAAIRVATERTCCGYDGSPVPYQEPSKLDRADFAWLLDLAERCRIAEAELARVAPFLVEHGLPGYGLAQVELPSEVGAKRGSDGVRGVRAAMGGLTTLAEVRAAARKAGGA